MKKTLILPIFLNSFFLLLLVGCGSTSSPDAGIEDGSSMDGDTRTDDYIQEKDCLDLDHDSYGTGSECLGPDCNDDDPACHEGACCSEPTPILEVHLMDIWGQPIDESLVDIVLDRDSNPIAYGANGSIVSLPLDAPGTYNFSLTAEDHYQAEFSIDFDGGDELSSASIHDADTPRYFGITMGHKWKNANNQQIPKHVVFVGLRHKWFSSQGRAARYGNLIELEIAGEQAWSRVYDDLITAQDSVLIGTWWWMSDFELIRDWDTHATLTEEQRWDNTIMGVLSGLPAVVRIMVGEFWGSHDILDWLTSDDLLREFAQTAGDDFEFMGQGNDSSGVFPLDPPAFVFGDRVRTNGDYSNLNFDPEQPIESELENYTIDMTDWPFVDLEFQIASWHQKFMVIDQRIAYIGGMNIKSTDWDSSDHLVFDHRRMNYDATFDERQEVINKERETDLGPRRDYMLRIEGPSVQDATDVFNKRWSFLIDSGVTFSENSTNFVTQHDQAYHADGSQVQVTATMPKPFSEQAIAETWFNAISQAQDYIYIEDQYWRIPWLVEAIAQRMRSVPSLRLIVITKPIDEWLDPGCEWTYRTNQQLLEEFGQSRYITYQLRTFDWVVTWGFDETESRFVDIDTHSKMLIVDDKFMSIGSCNKNNRGILYEGELNAAILDPVWVKAQRKRIFENLLPEGTIVADDTASWWQQFADAAAYNDSVYDAWDDEGWDIDNGDGSGPLPGQYLPDGFIYSLHFGEVDDCFFEGVGPDMTFRNQNKPL